MLKFAFRLLLARHSKARFLSQKAATLLETAIILPLFLFFILFVIWIGVSYHEKATLSSAVSVGIRAAATRSDIFLMNSRSGILPAVKDWVAGNPSATLDPVLARNAPGPSTWGEEFYNSPTGTLRVFSSLSPRDLALMPRAYIFTLIYVHESLRQSIGNSIRYPCDPRAGSDADGCVGCFFLNPDTYNEDPYLDPPPADRIALQCDYRPSNFLIGPISRLLGMVTGTGWAGPASLVFSEKRKVNFRDGMVE